MTFSLKDYLVVDTDLCEVCPIPTEFQLIPSVEEVEENPYSIGTPDEKLRHYRLSIQAQYRNEWTKNKFEKCKGVYDGKLNPLYCYTSAPQEPDLDQFSQDIRSECLAVMAAIGREGRYPQLKFVEFRDLEAEQIFQYAQQLKVDVERTEDFIDLYDDLRSRLYNSQKWMYYVKGKYGCSCERWPYPIGDRLWEFIYPDIAQ